MSNKPKELSVTIVTVVRNDASGLQLTLDSIREQTLQLLEHVIIDGASDDGTAQFASEIDCHDGKTIVISEPDRGIYDAMNKGIAMATHPWVLFMNAGDRFLSPDSLEQLMCAASDNVDVVYGDVILDRDNARERVHADLAKRSFHHQGMVYRKSLHETHGSYLVCAGVTISDYLFFNQVASERWVKCNSAIAICDAKGRSSLPNAYYQRLAVDLIVGNRGRVLTGLMLLIYPMYRLFIRPIVRKLW